MDAAAIEKEIRQAIGDIRWVQGLANLDAAESDVLATAVWHLTRAIEALRAAASESSRQAA